jgi:hypothetical protein
MKDKIKINKFIKKKPENKRKKSTYVNLWN